MLRFGDVSRPARADVLDRVLAAGALITCAAALGGPVAGVLVQAGSDLS